MIHFCVVINRRLLKHHGLYCYLDLKVAVGELGLKVMFSLRLRFRRQPRWSWLRTAFCLRFFALQGSHLRGLDPCASHSCKTSFFQGAEMLIKYQGRLCERSLRHRRCCIRVRLQSFRLRLFHPLLSLSSRLSSRTMMTRRCTDSRFRRDRVYAVHQAQQPRQQQRFHHPRDARYLSLSSRSCGAVV